MTKLQKVLAGLDDKLEALVDPLTRGDVMRGEIDIFIAAWTTRLPEDLG